MSRHQQIFEQVARGEISREEALSLLGRNTPAKKDNIFTYGLDWREITPGEDTSGKQVEKPVLFCLQEGLAGPLAAMWPTAPVYLPQNLPRENDPLWQQGHWVLVWEDEGTDRSALDALVALLSYLQKLISRSGLYQHKTPRLSLWLLSDQPQRSPYFFALRSLLKSLQKEAPRLCVELLGFSQSVSPSRIWLEAQAYVKGASRFEVLEGEAYHRLSEALLSRPTKRPPFPENQTVLITGGSGELGQKLAAHLIRRFGWKVCLVGRRKQAESIVVLRQKLGVTDEQLAYLQGDVTELAQVKLLVAAAERKLGSLYWVIHAAGLLYDGAFLTKDEGNLRKVLAPKIQGLENLLSALDGPSLEGLVCFSSLAGITGNRGQADYATANGFMDGYMRKLAQEKPATKWLSINWPLWAAGGMKPFDFVIEVMKSRFGLDSLTEEEGMSLFEEALSHKEAQLAVVKGQQAVFCKALGLPEEASQSGVGRFSPPPAPASGGQIRLRQIAGAGGQGVEKSPPSLSLALFLAQYAQIWGLKVSEVDLNQDWQDDYEESFRQSRLLDFVNQSLLTQHSPKIFLQHRNPRELFAFLIGETKKAVVNPPKAEVPPPVVRRDRALAQTQSLHPGPQWNRDALTEEIAIVGVDGRFPHADNLQEFWQHLSQGKNLVSEAPADRYTLKAAEIYENLEMAGEGQEIYGGFMTGMENFDAGFFKISPREARVMDPQQRLLLTSAWKCLENAGYKPQSLSGTETGVFVAISTRDFHEILVALNIQIEPQHSTGLAHSVAANRISYQLNLHGPSEAVDTACSSSLVALNRAVDAIQRGECEQALVGGVNLIVSPVAFVAFSHTGMLSTDGKCRAFGDGANGYVRGEGVGTLFLKRKSQAVADGDFIYATIKGSSVNHGGRGHTLTAPNPAMQAAVITKALRKSGVSVRTLQYIEAHGTGTALGDPVEVDGLKKAFAQRQKEEGVSELPENSVGIGSVKSNIGHLEAAAGMAGLMKVLLAMQHDQIPESLHLEKINPYVQLKNSPFYLLRQARPWPKPTENQPRRAGVSSFGFGGTNAHVILEQEVVSVSATESEEGQSYFFPFSAPSPEQLQKYLASFAAFLQAETRSIFSPANISYTLQAGRPDYAYRKCWVAQSREQLLQQLEEHLKAAVSPQEKNEIPSVLQDLLAGKAGTQFLSALQEEKEQDKLALLWENGLKIDWSSFYPAVPQRVPLPTYPLQETRYWIDEELAALFQGMGARPAEKEKAIARPAPTVALPDEAAVLKLLREKTAAVLEKKPADLDPDVSLLEYGLDSILGMSLVAELRDHFPIPLYPNEIIQHDSLRKLSVYLTAELKAAAKLNVKSDASEKPLVFLLSSPRSGSTLLRVMLMGHSQLFAPPEMHLLSFSSLAEREKLLRGTGLDEGLIEAVRSLWQTDTEGAKKWIKDRIEQKTTPEQLLQALQAQLGERVLVDKSPAYARDLAALQKAAAAFPQARFILLARHPVPVIRSLVANRFHRFLPVFPEKQQSPEQIAEAVWLNDYRNLRSFAESLSDERFLWVQFESLVNHPNENLQRICQFLNLPYEAQMPDVYQNDRMITGLHEKSLSIGDPNFLKHDRIEAGLAYAWQQEPYDLGVLKEETRDLMLELGYDNGRPYPLNPRQRIAMRYFDGKAWNLQHHFRLQTEQAFDGARYRQAMEALIRAHPILHRLYDPQETQWAFAKDLAKLYQIRLLEPTKTDDLDQRLEEESHQLLGHIDIQHGPVVAVLLAKIGDTYEGRWLYSHYLGDGISSLQLVNEFVRAMQGQMLVNRVPRQSVLAKEPVGVIEEAPPSVSAKLPFDFEKGPNDFASQQELRTMISGLARDRRGNPLFARLGQALAEMLGGWLGEQEIPLAIRYHNRNQEGGFYRGAGLFATDIAVSLALQNENTWERAYRAFQEATQTASDAYHWHSGGFFRFNFQPHWQRSFGASTVQFEDTSEYLDASALRMYQLDFIAREKGEGVELIVRYSENFFRKETVEGLLEGWKEGI
jgi:3-oxoacyl-(acyl-carrier-protein) synthase/NADP-dependent 3-hydroxy acid dehydrogenase YdfG/acyl carrier protein